MLSHYTCLFTVRIYAGYIEVDELICRTEPEQRSGEWRQRRRNWRRFVLRSILWQHGIWLLFTRTANGTKQH